MYFQFAFALDRVKALAPQHPEWKTKQPFKAVLEGDMQGGRSASGENGAARDHGRHARRHDHRGVRRDRRATGSRPRGTRSFDRPYTELVYQPMLELLAYLRANGFKTFIVSGGGVEFMRPWVERVYGIPPEQVVGSSVQDEVRDARRQAGADAAAGDRPRSTTRPASRSASTRSSAAGRSPRSATPTATSRCSSGRRRGTGAAVRADRPPHRRRARVGLRPRLAHRPARRAASTRRRSAAGWWRHEGRLEDGFPRREGEVSRLHLVSSE